MMTAVFLAAALLIHVAIVRVVLLATAAGPALWMLIQWIRRGQGVQVCDDHLLIQNPLLRRARRIPYDAVRGYAPTRAGGLAVVYEKPTQASNVARDQQRLALTDLRPDSHTNRPRYALVVTSPLNHADNLLAALAEPLAKRPAADQHFSTDDVLAWARRRRLRNVILILLAVLGTPLYVIVVGRIIAGFISYGAVNVAR